MRLINLISIALFGGALIGLAISRQAEPPQSAMSVVSSRALASVITAPLRAETLASELIGATVYDRGGAELGVVRDLMLGRSGDIAGLIVGVGDFFGFGGKRLAVPFARADVVKNQDGSVSGVRLELSREDANAAPSFQKDAGVTNSSGPAPPLGLPDRTARSAM